VAHHRAANGESLQLRRRYVGRSWTAEAIRGWPSSGNGPKPSARGKQHAELILVFCSVNRVVMHTCRVNLAMNRVTRLAAIVAYEW
jgi:hypothetical protein